MAKSRFWSLRIGAGRHRCTLNELGDCAGGKVWMGLLAILNVRQPEGLPYLLAQNNRDVLIP